MIPKDYTSYILYLFYLLLILIIGCGSGEEAIDVSHQLKITLSNLEIDNIIEEIYSDIDVVLRFTDLSALGETGDNETETICKYGIVRVKNVDAHLDLEKRSDCLLDIKRYQYEMKFLYPYNNTQIILASISGIYNPDDGGLFYPSEEYELGIDKRIDINSHDEDIDGYPNIIEAVAGTDLFDASSYPAYIVEITPPIEKININGLQEFRGDIYWRTKKEVMVSWGMDISKVEWKWDIDSNKDRDRGKILKGDKPNLIRYHGPDTVPEPDNIILMVSASIADIQHAETGLSIIINGHPVSNAGADQIVDPGLIRLDGTGSSDPNNDDLRYSWHQILGPVDVILSDNRDSRPQFTATESGIYEFELIVMDELGLRDMNTIKVTIRPIIFSTIPKKDVHDIPIDTVISVTFNSDMEPTTINASTFIVDDSTNNITGNINYDEQTRTATFIPDRYLEYSIEYTVTIKGDVKDLGGTPIEEYSWRFNVVTNQETLQVSTGNSHTCVLIDNGQIKCWGKNDYGQLGLGDVDNRGDDPGEMGDNLPVVDLGTDRTASQISAGAYHTCALLDNGVVKCWGDNSSGQLGLGDVNSRGDELGEMGDDLPIVDLGTGRTVLQVSTGAYHTCALLDDGVVKCWGKNDYGQLGLGDVDNRGDNPEEMGDNLPEIGLGRRLYREREFQIIRNLTRYRILF